MRWTLMAQKTNAPDADGEVVWSWRPDAGAKFLREAIPARATGAKEPGPRGEHDISRKPPRAGIPGDSGVLVVTNARAFYTTRAAAGALGARHSPHPLGWKAFANLGRNVPREGDFAF
jgi:hypothetical protein